MNPLQKATMPLFVGAVLILISLFTTSWLTASDRHGSAGLGLREAHFCRDRDEGTKCETMQLDDNHGHETGRETAMIWAGKITFGLGIVSALLSALCGGMILQQRDRRLVKAVIGVVAATAVGAVTFLIAVPSLGERASWGPGFSLVLFFVGAAGAIVGTRLTAKALGQPMLAAGAPAFAPGYAQQGSQPMAAAPGYAQQTSQPMAAAPTPSCPRDGAPSVWVAQYQRYFCERCQQYL